MSRGKNKRSAISTQPSLLPIVVSIVAAVTTTTLTQRAEQRHDLSISVLPSENAAKHETYRDPLQGLSRDPNRHQHRTLAPATPTGSLFVMTAIFLKNMSPSRWGITVTRR